MPQKSPTTFSLGQQLATETDLGTVSDASAEIPLYDFNVPLELGTQQVLPGLGSASSQPSFFSETSALKQAPNGKIVPTGARLRPALKLTGPGGASRLKTRQLWEGTVTAIVGRGFEAVLTDKTAPENPDEHATFEFDLTEISPEDKKLVQPGASFYWIIGNEQTVAGQVKNVSMLQFRRSPTWTKRALSQIDGRAEKVRKLFQDER